MVLGLQQRAGRALATLHYNGKITVTGIPLELFLRIITVSLETMKIVRSLPKLDI